MQMPYAPWFFPAPPTKNPKGVAAKSDVIPPPAKAPDKIACPDPNDLVAPPAPPKAEAPGAPAQKFSLKAKSKAKSRVKSISNREKAKIPCIFHRILNACIHACIYIIAHIRMKTRRMVAFQRASRNERIRLPKATFTKAMVA